MPASADVNREQADTRHSRSRGVRISSAGDGGYQRQSLPMATDELRIGFSRRRRPLRVGYRVDPLHPPDAWRAIETATAHWGGTLNPLLPAFRRRPTWWQLGALAKAGPVGIERAYADAFACDFVVDARSTAANHSPTYSSLTFDQLRRDTGSLRIEAGLPVAAIYAWLWRSDLRWQSREPARAVVPVAADSTFGLFVAVCFGAFDEQAFPGLQNEYRRTFDAIDLVITPDTLLDPFPVAPVTRARCLTPLSATVAGLVVRPQRRFSEISVIVVDPTCPPDLLDLWNLRASGRPVVAIPVPWIDAVVPDLRERLLGLQSSEGPRGTTVAVFGGRSVSEHTVSRVIGALDHPAIQALGVGHATPRNDLGFSWVAEAEDEVEATVRSGRVSLPLPQPPAAATYAPGRRRWMTVVEYLPWTLPRDGRVGGALPPELGEVTALLNAREPDFVAAGPEGLLVSGGTHADRLDVRVPSGRQVLVQLLTGDNANLEPSEPGRVAEQLIRQVGGLRELGVLQYQPLINLFNDAARSGVDPGTTEAGRRGPSVRFIPQPRLYEVLRRRSDVGDRHPAATISWLAKRDVLRIGLQLDCAHCAYPNWFALEAIAGTVKCERCLAEFPFPQGAPPTRNRWAYRPTGAFSVEGFANGGYAVAFGLRFLHPHAHDRASWAAGLQLTRDLEIDFAMVREDHDVWNGDRADWLLGEAKSFGAFEKCDFDRATTLRRKFPEATLVFATLRDALSSAERDQIEKLARPRGAAVTSWHPRVLVLTATELLSRDGAPNCWVADRGPRAEIFHKAQRSVRSEIAMWADITLQMHIGLSPHSEWVQSRRSARLA